MNYFIHDERDLSPAYVKSCKKFLKEISLKLQASSDMKRTQLKGRIGEKHEQQLRHRI